MIEKNYVLSGRNTVIHKVKKIDLLIVNGDMPVVIVTNQGLGIYKGKVPAKKAEAIRLSLFDSFIVGNNRAFSPYFNMSGKFSKTPPIGDYFIFKITIKCFRI